MKEQIRIIIEHYKKGVFFINLYWLAQIIGVVAISFWVCSVQKKEQYKILWMQSVANLAYTFQYMLLGVFSAASMNFSSCIRYYLFYRKRKEKKEISKIWLLFFIVIIIVLGAFTYQNVLSLIPIIITLFYTISSWIKNTKWMRIVFLVAAFVWIYYNYSVGAYVSMLGNVFEILSGVFSLIRFSNKTNDNKDDYILNDKIEIGRGEDNESNFFRY